MLAGALASRPEREVDTRTIADVAVFGTWTAWHLKQRGLTVRLLEV